MNRIGFVIALLFAICVIGPARADDVMVGNLKLTAAWARATPKGATVGGGYQNTAAGAGSVVGGGGFSAPGGAGNQALSTASTIAGGAGNFVVAIVELAGAALVSLLAVFAPLLVLLPLALIAWGLVRLARRRRGASGPPG